MQTKNTNGRQSARGWHWNNCFLELKFVRVMLKKKDYDQALKCLGEANKWRHLAKNCASSTDNLTLTE